MKLVITFLLLLSIELKAAPPESRLAVAFGDGYHESVWVREKTVQTKPLCYLGYQARPGLKTERVIPRSECPKLKKELQTMVTQFQSEFLSRPLLLCHGEVRIESELGLEELCISNASRLLQKKFFAWIKSQSDLVLGR